MTIQHLMKYQV